MQDDYEFYFPEENDDSPNSDPFLKQSTKIEEMERELAIHEASHFVFGSMLVDHFNEFTPIVYAVSCKDKIFEEGNRVHGIAPTGLTMEEIENNSLKLKAFYQEKQSRIIARAMVSLAGYASFKVFGETDHFVSVVTPENKTVRYVKFYTAFEADNSLPDFNSVKKYLLYFGFHPRKSLQPAQILLNGVEQIIQIPQVQEAIVFVHNELIKLNCEKLEGKRLDEVLKKVQQLTSDVPYMEVLDDLNKKLIELEESLKQSK